MFICINFKQASINNTFQDNKSKIFNIKKYLVLIFPELCGSIRRWPSVPSDLWLWVYHWRVSVACILWVCLFTVRTFFFCYKNSQSLYLSVRIYILIKKLRFLIFSCLKKLFWGFPPRHSLLSLHQNQILAGASIFENNNKNILWKLYYSYIVTSLSSNL